MEKYVIFREDKNKHGVYLFVKKFEPKRWFRREKIEYCIGVNQAESYSDSVVLDKVCERIKRDFPNAEIICDDYASIVNRLKNHQFWLIGRWKDDSTEEFYCDNDLDNKPSYTQDMNDVRFSLSVSSAKETLQTIRKSTRDRVYVCFAYLSLENKLLSNCMMITCTSKKSGVTKYFAREDGKRLRLVATSNAARKFSYEFALCMFDYLRTNNKNFLYAVLPVFKDNVNSKDIERYMQENKISRMIAMDLKLKFLNR